MRISNPMLYRYITIMPPVYIYCSICCRSILHSGYVRAQSYDNSRSRL